MSSVLAMRTLQPATALTRSLHASSITRRTHLPDLPKQPQNPFFKFMEKEKSSILAINREAKVKDLARVAGQRWRELPEDTKETLKEEYQRELAAWRERKAAVEAHLEKANLLDDVKAQMKEERLERAIRKAKRKQKELANQLGRPKAPTNAYSLFVAENLPKTSSANEARQAMKDMAAKWKSLAEDTRAGYERRATDTRQAYNANVDQWKKKVEGKEDAKALEKLEVRLGKLRLRKRQLKHSQAEEDKD
jgi:hypothetical protein